MEAQRQKEQEQLAAVEAQKEGDKQAALLAQQERERQAALETQRRLEREQLVASINNTISNQASQIAQFKTDTITRLDGNINKIAKATRSKRKALTEHNDRDRELVLLALQKENELLNQFPESLSSPSADPAEISTRLQGFVQQKDDTLLKLRAKLDALESEITNTPAPKGLLNFK